MLFLIAVASAKAEVATLGGVVIETEAGFVLETVEGDMIALETKEGVSPEFLGRSVVVEGEVVEDENGMQKVVVNTLTPAE
jgi:hypothetical protein